MAGCDRGRGRWRGRRCERGCDRGFVTAEAALVLPVLVLFATALVWGLMVVAAQIQCVDAARAGARAAARQDSGSSVAAARIACAISRGLSTRKPVTPCSMISGSAPDGKAMTGVPAAMDSAMTRPNGSGQRIGKSVAIASP